MVGQTELTLKWRACDIASRSCYSRREFRLQLLNSQINRSIFLVTCFGKEETAVLGTGSRFLRLEYLGSTMTVEILAHISSRARREDDERHKRQAEAYLKFEPARTIKSDVTNIMKRHHEENNEMSAKRQKTSRDELAERITNTTMSIGPLKSSSSEIIPEKSEAVHSPSALKRSFSDMVGMSTSKLIPQSPMILLELASTKWKRYRDQEKPLPVPNADLETKRGKVITISQIEDTQHALSFIQDDIDVGVLSSDGPNHLNHETDTGVNLDDMSFIPSELSSYDPNATKSDTSKALRTEAGSPREPQNNGQGEISFLPSTLSSFGPTSTKTEASKSSGSDNVPESDSQEDISPDDSQHTTASKPPTSASASFSKLPMRIDSPPPTEDFLKREGIPSSAVTQSLQALTSSLDVSAIYQPLEVIRNPRNWERGHWLIDTGEWSSPDELSFWRALVEKIYKGHAGLATWAARNVARDGSQPEDGLLKEEDGIVCVRIYCWGSIAKELYLLSHLASNGRVDGSKAKWVSAVSGEDVILMK
jgi:hypothetical protein